MASVSASKFRKSTPWDSLLNSIRGRLFLTAAAVTVPAVLLSILLITEAQRNERAMVQRQLQETARTLALVVDRQLGQADALLRALATSPAVAERHWETLHRQAEAALRGSSEWVVLTEGNGRQLMNSRVPYGTPLPQTSHHRAFEGVEEKGGTYVSSLFSSADHPAKVLSVAVPVKDEQGEVIYALAIVMRPSSLSGILSEQTFPSTWVAGIIDGDGTIVARNRRAEEFVGMPATTDIRAAIRVRKQAIIESTTLDGARVLAAYNRAGGTGWTVIVGAPREEVEASGHQLMLMTLLMTFLLVALGVGTSAWAGRGVIRSVQRLVAAASAVGTGVIPEDKPTGTHETDQVAQALREAALRLHRRESELRQLNESLEGAVQNRTVELAEANHALSIRNQELQDFAHVASHDLQEPLRQIRSFSGIIQNDYAEQLDETSRSYLHRIEVAGQRMSRLIRDLLAFSRISTQGQPDVAVDLNKTLNDVLADLEIRLRETEGRVEAATLPVIRADPSQMHQLFLNLVGNALKFHRPDVPPEVRVHPEVSNELLKIIVEDNGIGFDPEYSDQIFSPFQRLHGRDSFEGTGIGLAIVRRIVERHGGTVTATGRPGEGSRFEVTLPAKDIIGDGSGAAFT